MIPPNATAKPVRVLFLADSGPDVGGGHVMRCLTLAGALARSGVLCAFVATPETAALLDAFAGPEIMRLDAQAGEAPVVAAQAVSLAELWGPHAVVIDHYGLDALQEARLRAGGRRIVVLDDTAERRHDADLLIDPSLGRIASDYQALLPGPARALTGPAHALLRPQFAAAREDSLARRSEAPVRRLLIALGLTDLRGITGRVVNAIRAELKGLSTDIVVGATAPSLTWLRHLEGEDPDLRVHVDVQDMAGLMAGADMGIGAGGASVWERACVGLPALNLVLAENQAALARDLDEHGAVLAVEARGRDFPERLLAAFTRVRDDGALRLGLARTSASLCDGEGALRVAQAITDLVA